MPRGFTEQERAIIRAKLLDGGRAALTAGGVRKTSVDDLVASVGISKGAFYLFFDSKEALFLAIISQFEDQYQADLLGETPDRADDPHAWLCRFFQRAVTHWRSSPLFQGFDQDDHTYLTRKLPPEQTQGMLTRDEEFAARLLRHWENHGLLVATDPATFTGLMRALFYVTLHADDIGERFPETLSMLVDALVRQILRTTP
jgi:AcrR family transcriptional regulator